MINRQAPHLLGIGVLQILAEEMTTELQKIRETALEKACTSREEGNLIHHLGAFENNSQGNGIARIYGDLRHWDLGPGIAESIDETGTGSSVFMTENLWGVGSTPPYLHDGRATTLTEAILFHDGQATQARTEFLAMSDNDKHDIVSFLQNLVLYVSDEEE
jgi:CxxC motif-containing protein (DUF1111 family)